MLKQRSFPSALAALALVATFAAPACTSNSSGGAGGGSASSYCSLFSNYVSSCHITDACTLASLNDCSTLAAQFSNGYLELVQKCESNLACPDSGAAANAATACFQSGLASLPPTGAQEKLAQDYCTACPATSGNVASCVASFYRSSSDSGISQAPPFASNLLMYSDSIIEKLDTGCAAGVADAGIIGCAFGFTACSVPILTANVPAAPACTGDAG